MIRLRAGKRHGDAAGQVAVRGRVVAVDPAAQDGDGQAARIESPAMGGAVDPAGQSAHDDEARGGELAAEHARRLRPVRRARPRAHDGHGRSVKELRLARAAEEETDRGIVDGSQQRREVRTRAAHEADPFRLQLRRVRRLLEPTDEGREARAPRPLDLVGSGLGGEGGDGELAHGPESSVGER